MCITSIAPPPPSSGDLEAVLPLWEMSAIVLRPFCRYRWNIKHVKTAVILLIVIVSLSLSWPCWSVHTLAVS